MSEQFTISTDELLCLTEDELEWFASIVGADLTRRPNKISKVAQLVKESEEWKACLR